MPTLSSSTRAGIGRRPADGTAAPNQPTAAEGRRGGPAMTMTGGRLGASGRGRGNYKMRNQALFSPETTSQSLGLTSTAQLALTPALDDGLATELLGTYIARRRLLEKAAQVTTSMHEKALEVAESEVRNRLLTNIGGSSVEAKAKALKAMNQNRRGTHAAGRASSRSSNNSRDDHQHSGRERGRRPQQNRLSRGAGNGGGDGHVSFGGGGDAANSTPGSQSLSVGSSGARSTSTAVPGLGMADVEVGIPEAEQLRQQVTDKCEQLDRLRGLQRAIAEWDEATDTRQRVRGEKAERPLPVLGSRATSAGTAAGDTIGSRVASAKAALAIGSRGASARSMLPVGNNSALVAGDSGTEGMGVEPEEEEECELRVTFNKLVGKENDDGGLFSGVEAVTAPPPPEPPAHFSANALAVTLESLGTSLASLIEVTDALCVMATFKARDEEVNVGPHIQALVQHVRYLLRAYAIAARHLAHFESGERALLDGGNFEINSLREKFLMHKEALTAQEQREKQAEDTRNALRARLQLLNNRLDMWEEVLFGRPCQKQPQRTQSASMATRSSLSPTGRRGSLQPSWLPTSRRVSLSLAQRSPGAGSVLISVPSSGPGGIAPAPSAAVSVGDGESTCGGVCGDSHETLVQESAPAAAVDPLERRLALRWGNPYVAKSILYEQQAARSLVPGGTMNSGDGETPLDADGTGTGTGIGGGFADTTLFDGRHGPARPPLAASPELSDFPGAAAAPATDAVSAQPSSISDIGGGGGHDAGEGPGGAVGGAASPVMASPVAASPVGTQLASMPSNPLWVSDTAAVADARILALLQSLQRTIPVNVRGDSFDASESGRLDETASTSMLPSMEASATTRRDTTPLHAGDLLGASEADSAARRMMERRERIAVRDSIHRLVRYLQKPPEKPKE